MGRINGRRQSHSRFEFNPDLSAAAPNNQGIVRQAITDIDEVKATR